jgi:hypothetical protein
MEKTRPRSEEIYDKPIEMNGTFSIANELRKARERAAKR